MLETIITEARENGDFQAVADAIPYMSFLGLRVRPGAEGLLCILPPDQKLVGNIMLPALHGGVVGAFLESAAIMQLFYGLKAMHVPKTVDITIDYLRPVKPEETFALGIITKQGRRIANVRVEAWQGEDRQRLVAAAHGHFLLS